MGGTRRRWNYRAVDFFESDPPSYSHTFRLAPPSVEGVDARRKECLRRDGAKAPANPGSER